MESTPVSPLRFLRRRLSHATAAVLLVDVLFFVSGLGQTAIVPLLPRMSAAFGLGPSASALVLALPAFVMLAVSVPAGMLSDRLGARRVTIASGILLVVGCAVESRGSLTALLLGRAVYGLSFGMLWTAGAAWLARLGGGRRVGPAVVFSSVGTMVGPTLGGLLGSGASGALPFSLIAAAGLLVSGALVLAPRPPAVTASRGASTSQGANGRASEATGGRSQLVGFIRNRRVLAGAGSLVVSGSLGGVTQLLTASGLHGDGVSASATGLAFSACAVGYIAVSSAFVALGPRSHTPAINAIVTGLGAIALVPALVSSAPVVLIAALMLTAAPRGAINVVAYGIAGSGTDADDQGAGGTDTQGGGGGGAVFGLLGGAWAAANVLTPLCAGALAEHVGLHMAYLAAIVPAVGITIALVAALPRGPDYWERAEEDCGEAAPPVSTVWSRRSSSSGM